MSAAAAARCPRCDAGVGARDRYCTACGYGVAEAESDGARALALPDPPKAAPGVVSCPACGAVNASSRRECARCHTDLDGDDRADPGSAPHPAHREDPPAAAEAEPVSRALVISTVIAALVVGAVILMLLGARGIGLFDASAGAAPDPGTLVELEIVDIAVSSSLPASGSSSYGPDNLVDGDPETAWNEGAEGDGTAEWVELALDGEHRVARLLLWNGHQKDQLFFDNGRVRTLRIDAGERILTVELLDRRGPQAVDLREPAEADRLRLTIEAVYPGERYADAALSDVEVFGVPAGQAPGSGNGDQPDR